MASASLILPADYWQTLHVTSKDIEFLQTYLFEHETPLTPRELVEVLVAERSASSRNLPRKSRKISNLISPGRNTLSAIR